MNNDDEWSSLLQDHPIFSLPKKLGSSLLEREDSLELSTSTLPKFTSQDPTDDGPTPSGRRQTMVLKDSELILAAGKELRITSLSESRLNKSLRKTYKTLGTPSIQFEIHELALNPSGKLLAVAGAFQVAVVVLPRSGVTRLVPEIVDCKSVQIGQFYHAATSSIPIAKIEWHPWGEAGSTLMVMTIDGKLREYDISVDTEEPQQILTFMPERKSKSFIAQDDSERQIASFTFGRGMADWGPLTVYAVTMSGDVYAICPYMPQNASIPSAYVHALECFVAAKQEYLAQAGTDSSKSLSTMYDYQQKYIAALTKQLPLGTVFPAASRSILMHPPSTIKPRALRQGPFLLQPSPRALEGSEGGDATDIIYVSCGSDEDESATNEQLGIILIAFQDGKVDLCLDLEKIEAKWETKHSSTQDLPMLAVYETIDLGLISTLQATTPAPQESPILELLQGNHPVFLPDPIHYDIVFVSHAFGVHSIHLGPCLRKLLIALRANDSDEDLVSSSLSDSTQCDVRPILCTFSVERRCSNPVVAIAIPNDVYVTYSIFILTSTMRLSSFPLNLRPDSPAPIPTALPEPETVDSEEHLTALEGPPAYISLLGMEPYQVPPILSRSQSGLPINPRLSTPSNSKEFMLTPDSLRYLGTTVAKFSSQIHEIQLAFWSAQQRATLQKHEFLRQREKGAELVTAIQRLSEVRFKASKDRIARIQDTQKELLRRLDRTLQHLMLKASPVLSEHETKWFEELQRMKQDVAGSGRFDETSLVARTKMLERDLKRLMPRLKALAEKEKQLNDKQPSSQQGVGFSQAFELGERSSQERAKILEAEKEILLLASKLDVSLGQPPPLQ
ncbi:hypothetical protein EYR36_006139 [Pleurotus pulmonarius]|nr:hypothetical protein EYR36_006139 [Pleurotus pulmonarius]